MIINKFFYMERDMANRWVSYSKAAENIKDYYTKYIGKELPEIVIDKSCVQRFEKLLENVLEYDLMNDENTAKDIEVREHFYNMTFIAEEYTNLLKKLRKEEGRENLDYIADYVFSYNQIAEELDNISSCKQIVEYINENPYKFHTIENLKEIFPKFHTNEHLDKGYYKDLYEFLYICTLGCDRVSEGVNSIFHHMSLELHKDKQENDIKIYQAVIKRNVDEFLKKNYELIKDFEIENFYVEYNLQTTSLSFPEAVVLLLRLKIYTLTMNIKLTKEWEYYSIFSQIPLLNDEGQMSVSDIVRMTTSYIDSRELNNNIRRFQRRVQKDYELFVKKISKKIEVEKLKNMKYYFVQLIILSEEIKEEENEEENKYIKIIKETKRIIYRIINDEHLTYKEWNHVLSFIVYKDMEYYLKEKTFDFMKFRIIEESRLNKKNLNLLIETFDKVTSTL